MTRGAERPAAAFERWYASRPRALAAPDTTDAGRWESWRSALRLRLEQRLGVQPRPGPPPDVDVAGEVPLADGRRLRLMVEMRPGVVAPVWLLLPPDAVASGRAVIAVHGHGSGVADVVGLLPDGTPRRGPAGYQHDFALALVRRGFIVAAPELLAFGARREPADIARGEDASSCRSLATWALMLGTTVIGQRVLDLVRVVDLLVARTDVDPSAVGIFGISGGATASLFASVLDERLAVVALSGYVTSFRASVLAMEHCICNLVPGLVADVELADVALGLSPRPLIIEAGSRDPIFPIAAARAAARRISRGYTAQGAVGRFELAEFEGGHEVSGARAYDFLSHWLDTDPPRLRHA